MSGRDRDARQTAAWLRGCARVGEDVRLLGRPSLELEGGAISIGNRCTISSRPVASHFAAGPGAALEIGDDVWIGHGAAIAAFERVDIGAGTRIAPFLVLMDTNFHGNTGDHAVQHDCRPVVIGRNCCIGSRVIITRGVSIGDGAEILAGSVVSSSIPAGACAGGARARLLGRAGEPASRWDGVAAVLTELVREELGLESTPDLDTAPAQLPGWDVTHLPGIVAVLERQFGVALAPSLVLGARSLGDVAAAIEAARRSS